MSESGKILGRFDRFFNPERVERERAVEELKDVQAFVGTEAYTKFREMLQKRMTEQRWTPGMPQEAAAASLIAQTVYQQVLEDLDRLVRRAMEKI